MRERMWRQPDALRALPPDREEVERAARRLDGWRVNLVGTGTSWHAANHGAFLLAEAGVEARPVQAIDAALHEPRPRSGDALVLLGHRNTKRYASQVLARARGDGVETVVVSGVGSPDAHVATVEQERSAASTASHLGALLRLAQLACALGAPLELEGVPDVVAAALEVRETVRVAAEGLNLEQLRHGPSVALDGRDALACLDGGGPAAERVARVAHAAAAVGVAVQRIGHAERSGTDRDAFGFDVPGRGEAWEPLGLG